MPRRRLYIKCDIWEECNAKISDNEFEYYCCESGEATYWEDCPYYSEQKKKTPREWAEDYGLERRWW